MFTGIVEEIGTILSVRRGAASSILSVSALTVLADMHIGDSIAVNGVCLTVTSFAQGSFTADIMHETLNRSSLGSLRQGDKVNLERAMAADGRFGGHLVTGHIDGVGKILQTKRDDIAVWYTIQAAPSLLRYIVEKGAITIDGISLTVADVTDNAFHVSVIPHTAAQTTLSLRKAGDQVNLENDILGKYVEKLLLPQSVTADGEIGITEAFLVQHGFRL